MFFFPAKNHAACCAALLLATACLYGSVSAHDGCFQGSAEDPTPFHAPDLSLVGTGAPQAEQATATIDFPAARADRNGPSLNARRQPQGSLSGKIVYIGAGHGWTADSGAAYTYGWFTQRGINLGMVEDYGNLDQMYIFAQYLWNAGATVVPTRPIGFQPNEVILDNDDTTAGASGFVTYTGSWSQSAGEPYFAKSPDTAGDNYRFTSSSSTGPFATVEYHPNIPAEGIYPVYTWVLNVADDTPASSNRINQLYRVHHAGGTTDVRVNHRRVGKGWVWLGSYRFAAGTAGYVEITSEEESGDPGSVVIADGIRFGNGIGDVNRGEGISGWPREVEASRYWAVRGIGTGTGASSTIYDSVGSDDQSDNVGTPPRWAAYMNFVNDGAFKDRLYISFHSNAGGGRGCDGLYNDPALFPGTNTTNQEVFAETLGREVNEDMRQLDSLYFPGYTAWTTKTVHKFRRTDFAFGEIRADTINDEMDATIIEVAYHDDSGDVMYMKDALARRWMARAVYQGIVRFYNNVHGESLTMLPDEPRNLRALNATDSSNNIILTWEAPVANVSVEVATPGNIGGAAPTDYAVYTSSDGKDYSFRGLVGSAATTYTITGLSAGETVFAMVAAVNAGGESLPGNVAGARVEGARPPILIVDGFDRYENTQTPNDTVASNSFYNIAGSFARIIPSRINDFSYVAPLGEAISLSSEVRSFDSCTNDAVISGAVPLTNYDAVFWIMGEESTGTSTFGSTEQTLTEAFVAGGGHLFVSGSEVGWDLGRTGASSGNKTFYENTLRATRFATGNAEDDAGTYNVQGAVGGIFAGIGSFSFDNGSNGDFDAEYPDILPPFGAGTLTALTYVGGSGSGQSAGIQYDGTGSGRGKIVFLGFPFETITNSVTRTAMANETLVYFFGPTRVSHWFLY